MKILTVVGARPQFVKAAAVSRTLRENHTEILVHTGQHYDKNMSEVFFHELNIPKADYNLEVGSAGHSVQTGQMLVLLEPILEKEKPHWVLVYGDTNSTLAGALTASKLKVPVAHVEAGLRSYNRAMPEEINRVLTDHISSLLFCPSEKAVKNLEEEGIVKGVKAVGDVMYDAILRYAIETDVKSHILQFLDLHPRSYLLTTIHRASNVDVPENLVNILDALSQTDEIVVFPAHPRVMKTIRSLDIQLSKNIKLIDPVGYFDMLQLEKNARMILTDSGGVQKEAYWFKIPCLTLREETEWVETVELGWNLVVGVNSERILDAVHNFSTPTAYINVFGDGKTSQYIVECLENEFK